MKKLIVFMTLAMAMGVGVAGAQTKNGESKPAEGPKSITLEDIWTKGTFRTKGVYGIRSMADGEHYCTMSRTGIAKYGYASGEKEGDVCLFEGAGVAFESYEFSADEQKILLSAGFEPLYRHSGVSDYYIYDVKAKTFTKISENGKQRLTTFSPDGTKVAFVRDNNLYWMDLATLEEHAITKDGKVNEIINGTTDWVYEEEFAITKGFEWSPDSKKIAYMRFDESKVKEYNMQMWGALYPEDYRYKYPKAGEDNSMVEIRVYDVNKQQGMYIPALVDVATTSEDWEYLPRFQWTPSNRLAVMRMNRLQNHMQIHLIDPTDGNRGLLIYDESDKAYVEVPDTWQFITVGKGKKAKEQMLITSEEDGYRHIFRHDFGNWTYQQLTSGEWEVCDVVGVDAANSRLYYTSREHGAINKSLYMVDFGGKKLKKTCLNHKGLGTYNTTFSEGCKYYICTWSDANHAPVYTLHDSKGKLIKTLQDNAELQQKMDDYGTGHKQFSTFTTNIGTELNYYTIKPANFDANKKYPVLIYVYGGPGNQQVSNSYGYSDYYWYHMLAEKGYVHSSRNRPTRTSAAWNARTPSRRPAGWVSRAGWTRTVSASGAGASVATSLPSRS